MAGGTTFARLYSLERNKECFVNERCSLLNGSLHFTWAWRRNLRSGHESDQLDTLMGLLKHHYRSICLLTRGKKIRWNKLVPIKINIRLPTRSNLDSCGIDLHSLLRPADCDDNIESAQHLLLDCNLASDLWSSILNWWNLDNLPYTLMDVITWVDSANFHVVKDILDGVILTTVWVIWSYRNKICFGEKHHEKITSSRFKS